MNKPPLDQLYAHPELYSALRRPDPALWEAFWELACRELGHPPRSALDPACGPGDWLRLLAEKGVRVAGNDLSPQMAETARARCQGFSHEITEGDMSDLRLRSGPFELVFEVAGTVGILEPEVAFPRFLRGLVAQTAPGGLILLSLFFAEPEPTYPYVAYRSPAIALGNGGFLVGTYEVLGLATSRPEAASLSEEPSAPPPERLLRRISVQGGPQDGLEILDHYQMHAWTLSRWESLLSRFPELEWVTTAALAENWSAQPLSREALRGEVTVALRRKG